MRIEELAQRIAAAPRAVVIALVGLSLLISPGFVRVSGNPGHGLEAQRPESGFAEREVAVFSLTCRDGVFTKPCLRLVSRVTEALEAHAQVAGSVRSLANAHVVRARYGALRLVPLSKPLPESDAALRDLRGRLRSDDALQRRFVSPDGHSSFVYAELERGRPEHGERALADWLRAAFDRPPALAVTLLGAESETQGHPALVWLALVLGTLALGLAPGGSRAATLAGCGALALGVFAQTLVGLLGETVGTLGRFAPAILVASALSSSFALISRSRAEHRREPAPAASVAAALAGIGPTLALGALVSASGFAAILVLAPDLPRGIGLGAAAALAVALVAYPLGVALAGLIAWPKLLELRPGELSTLLTVCVERLLVRPRSVAWIGALGLALSACALAAFAPKSGDATLKTVVFDSGSPGAALEPVFLERVAAFQREAVAKPGIVWSSSLVDAVVAPANRALHDGDPLFATVPLTRTEIELALRPWQRNDRRALSRLVDDERRRISVEMLVVPSAAAIAPLTPRALASTLLTIGLVAVLGAVLLRSARGGAICAAPAATAGVIVLALASALGGNLQSEGAALAPLTAALAAGLGLPFLARARALFEAGAQLEIVLSRARRETGPANLGAALASSALVAFLGALSSDAAPMIALVCLAPLIACANALAVPSLLVRATRGRFFSERPALHTDVSTIES